MEINFALYNEASRLFDEANKKFNVFKMCKFLAGCFGRTQDRLTRKDLDSLKMLFKKFESEK